MEVPGRRLQLAKAIEEAGATIINTGIGWHEARVPTIATSVPRAAFTWVTEKLKGSVSIPLVTSNRINMPHVAEEVLANGHADMVSMARPFLADPDLVNKAREGREDEINTCIDVTKRVWITHLEICEPRASSTRRRVLRLSFNTCNQVSERIAVVGAGPAGLACSTVAARRGHDVTLFDADFEIGGQFNMAKIIPGKEEFHETIRYFSKQIELTGVKLELNSRQSAQSLLDQNFDEIILATESPSGNKYSG